MKRCLAFLLLIACGPDETVSAFGSDDDYILQSMNGSEVSVPISINISEPGQISGRAPCNSYSAAQTAPYPWFELGPVLSTRATCSEQALENKYLAKLATMKISEVSDPVLILSNDAKETLVFQSP